MSKLKMSYLCFLVLLVGISLPMVFGEQNILTVGSFDTNPIGGTDANSIDGWGTWNDEKDPAGSGLYNCNTEHRWDPTVGHDALGSARLDVLPSYWDWDDLVEGEEDETGYENGWWENQNHVTFLYTRVACEEDMVYQIDGYWKGDLSVDPDDEKMHWTELRLSCWFQHEDSGLEPNGDPNAYDMDEYMLSRLAVVKYSTDPEKYGNTFPRVDEETEGVDQDSGQFDWLKISDCHWDDKNGVKWEEDEVIVAEHTGYMYIGFGFRLKHGSQVEFKGQQRIWIDDITVTACQGIEASDLNEDCQTTLADFVIVANDWVGSSAGLYERRHDIDEVADVMADPVFPLDTIWPKGDQRRAASALMRIAFVKAERRIADVGP